MHFEHLRRYCLSKPGAQATFPFDEDTLVFKVAGKMFALTSLSRPTTVNLKCDPERAVELRAAHEDVQPGWHMNKRHWNTVRLDGHLGVALIETLIDESYRLVVSGLSRARRRELGAE